MQLTRRTNKCNKHKHKCGHNLTMWAQLNTNEHNQTKENPQQLKATIFTERTQNPRHACAISEHYFCADSLMCISIILYHFKCECFKFSGGNPGDIYMRQRQQSFFNPDKGIAQL